MAPTSYTPYNPADHGPPSALLPEEVFGHVDVATLGDITRYLHESESQDDTELATWIQQNYLHGLRNDQSTATIRTPEGFAQLDRAYRRVRSLTNKAQDKWPFFDRNFKQMSTATVRNNARGEAAPGIMFHKDGMRRSSALGEQPQVSLNHDGFDTSNASLGPQIQAPFGISLGPQLQAPFGTKNPGRFQARKPQEFPRKQQELPRPSRQTPVPLPSKLPPRVAGHSGSENQSAPPEQQDLRRSQRQTTSPQELPKYTAQDLVSESDGQAMLLSEASHSDKAAHKAARPNAPPSEPAHSDEPETSQQSSDALMSTFIGGVVSRKSSSELSEEPDLDSMQDASAGKVRARNGRYLPKEQPVLSPKSKKNGKKRRERARMSNLKEVEKRRSAARSSVSVEPEQDSEHEQEQELEQAPEPEPEHEPDHEPESPALVHQAEDVFADVQSPSPSVQDDTIEVHSAIEPNDKPAEPAQMDTAVLSVNGDDHLGSETEATPEAEPTPEPTPAYLLAAEADAVPSNLDRLPPNSRRTSKRKSEPIAQPGPVKKRKVGRPRKSEQLPVKEEVSPQKNDMFETKEVPQMTTRRTTRRAAAALLQETPKSTPEVRRDQAPRAEPPAVQESVEEDQAPEHEDEDVVMGGVEEDATAGQEEEEAHAPAPSASKLRAPSTTNSRSSSLTPARTPISTKKIAPPISDEDLLNIGLSKTSSPSLHSAAPYVSPYQPVPPPNFTANMNGQKAKTNGSVSNGTNVPSATPASQLASPIINGAALNIINEHAPGHVEYFARITTETGMMEVPIAPEQLDKNEEKMIRKYAEWNAVSGAVQVPYAQFRQIFAFAIQQE